MFLAGLFVKEDFRLERPGLLACGICGSGFGFLGVFGGICFATLWSCGASLGAVLGHLKADDTLLNDLSIVLQSPSNVKHY